MATNIALQDDLYNQVVKRARAVDKTPEEWVDQTIGERLRRESASALLDQISAKNLRDMASLGVDPADVEGEIADYRRNG